jgi:hypothetical protein
VGEGKGPKRGYSWAPFQPGHELSTKHGAWSPRKVDPLAAEIAAEARQVAPWLTAVDEPALKAWATCEARIHLVETWLLGRATADNAGGMLDDDGEVRGATNLLVKLETAAAGHRDRLGFTPLARARLGRDVAATKVDVARLMADLPDDRADVLELDDQEATDG